MTTVRATSDLHLSETSAPIVWKVLEALRADAEAHPGYTVLCGDIFDQSISIHMPTWNKLRQTLIDWPDQVILIAGNHDQYGRHGRNCLEGMWVPGSVELIEDPIHTPIGLMLPYTEPDAFVEALAAEGRCEGQPPIIWCHHGFKGAYKNAMRRDDSGVSCLEIPDGHLIITGHYHMPQTLGRVIYCGSPYQTTFAEEGQEKGWLRWDDIYADPMPKRIAFDIGAPRHWTINWDPTTGPPTLPEGHREGDRVRIRTTATKDTVKDAAAQLKAAGLEGVAVIAQPADIAAVRVGGGTSPHRAAQDWVRSTRADAGQMLAFADDIGLWEK